MEKGSQIGAINGELQLPEPIIHHIQSFLTSEEAAQTAILSKSWRSAWLTRPNLDFYITRGGEARLELAEKTIQRYEQSNLKIESLKLCNESRRGLNVDFGVFANDLITRALKIGATNLSVEDYERDMVLSQDVFEAENLVELSLIGCKIDDLGFDRKVKCSKLESLSLSFVKISSEMISNIASCCPLILKLSLNLNPFDREGHVYYSILDDLSSSFPSLKDLTLRGFKPPEVSSRSIERLNFATEYDMLSSVKFDVPSIREFSFEIEGEDNIPLLSFVPATREWESGIFIKDIHNCLSNLWFRRLNKFLTELSQSRIYLSLEIGICEEMSCQYEVGDIRGLPKPEVGSLLINNLDLTALECFALFHGLFQICRPKFIIAGCMTRYGHIIQNGLLCKTLARGLDNKSMYDLHDLEEVNVHFLHDLEEVNVHFFEEDVDPWQSMALESLLDPSISPSGRQTIRFELKWKT